MHSASLIIFFAIVPVNDIRAHECLDGTRVHSQLKFYPSLSPKKESGKGPRKVTASPECMDGGDIKTTTQRLTKQMSSRPLTAMNVPGRKNNVTSVMIFIETVSVLVLRAILLISSVTFSIFLADLCDSAATTLFDLVFWNSSKPYNYMILVYARRLSRTA